MDLLRAPNNAQTRLKLCMTPLWTASMGRRLRIARERLLKTQAELGALLSTPGSPVSQQQVAGVEHGRLGHLDVTWARLEAVLGKHAGYVLIAKDEALYDERAIGHRYYEYTQKTRRKNANPELKYRNPLPKKRGSAS
jgi:transcriptional regulator with XRE-family HTH domain